MNRYSVAIISSILVLAGCGDSSGDSAPLDMEADAPAAAVSETPVEAVPSAPTLSSGIVITPTADIIDGLRIPGKVSVAHTPDNTLVITGTNAGTNSGGETSGVAFILTGEDEAAASRSRTTVSIVARALNGGTSDMKVSYSTNDVGNSGWQTFSLGADYDIYTFEYVVPTMQTADGDYLGILPATAEPGIEIASVGFDFEPLPAPEPEAAPE